MGVGVGGVEEDGSHPEALHKCVVKISLRSMWIGFGHGGHREGSGGLYQDGGSPPEGPVVVSFEVHSEAGWTDNVSGTFYRTVRMGKVKSVWDGLESEEVVVNVYWNEGDGVGAVVCGQVCGWLDRIKNLW